MASIWEIQETSNFRGLLNVELGCLSINVFDLRAGLKTALYSIDGESGECDAMSEKGEDDGDSPKGSHKFVSFDKLGILSQPGGEGGSDQISTFL